MNTLPCELLQLIASYLLPRYQCRLAITSNQYMFLYSPLLSWHARKATLSVPKHQIYSSEKDLMSVLSTREHGVLLLIKYKHNSDKLMVKNLTKMMISVVQLRAETPIYTQYLNPSIMFLLHKYNCRNIIEENRGLIHPQVLFDMPAMPVKKVKRCFIS